MSVDFSSFSIIIPAYNEEDAIEDIIQRCLNAFPSIIDKTPVESVEILVVSDGSVDKTVERAQKFEDKITLISYLPNKGYGAAIKTGFEAAHGQLVSFLDADGTCDPLYFVDMINKVFDESADIVIGSRMGPQSKMPAIRRLGNRIFVKLIQLLSKQDLTDSASGMRVIKKNKLKEIYPLPDGLHFTPAMSVKALFDSHLKIAEVDMTYEERVGESKLSVLKDGIRFLRVIFEAALGYNPFRIMAIVASFLFLFSFLYVWYPFIYFLEHSELAEWMIYRLIAVFVTFTAGVLLIIIGRVTQTLMDLANNNKPEENFLRKLTDRIFLSYGLLTASLSGILSIALLWTSLSEYITIGTVSQHWSIILVGSFGLLFSFLAGTTGILNIGLNYIKYRFESR